MSNNLRDETGALIGGLTVEEYIAGIEDFENQKPPPDWTTPSYDLGRQRAAQEAERDATFKRWLKDEDDRRDKAMKDLLSPDQYAEYRRQIDQICCQRKR